MIKKTDKNKFTFSRYQKIQCTEISDQILPIGSEVETLEGVYKISEPSHLAIDMDGNIYPIARSIFIKSYIPKLSKF